MHIFRKRLEPIFSFGLGLIVTMQAGCGVSLLEPPLPDLVEGLTLSELEAIQDDPRLTDDEKRQAIRDAIGAPETDAGDRLVEFLLNLNVP